MRVLFPHQNFVGQRQTGNARAVRVVAALVEAGFAVDVVAADRSYLGVPIEGSTEARERALSIARVRLPEQASKGRSYLSFQAGVLALARRIPRPDVVLATTPPLPGVGTALALAARWRVPMVLELRDLWPAFLVEGGLLADGPVARGMEVLELAALDLAAGVVSVSPGFLPYLRALGVSDPAVAVTGLDPDFARPPALPRSPGFEVTYTGSLNEAYGVDVLVDLVVRARVRGWRTVVAGAGRGADLVRGTPGLDYLGPLPRTDVASVLHRAHAGLNLHAPWPLLATTLTGKLFEYLAAGLPVVDAAGGAMGALVEHLGAGLVAGREPDTLVEALAHLEADPKARERMAEAGSAALAGPLSADVQARHMAWEIRRLVHGPPITPRRLAAALAHASARVARRAPARALAEAYAGQPGLVAAEAMRAWLAEQTPPERVEPLAVPAIL